MVRVNFVIVICIFMLFRYLANFILIVQVFMNVSIGFIINI